MATSFRRSHPLKVPVFAILLLLAILGVGYLVASYVVYDELATVPGECSPDEAGNTPQAFAAGDLDPRAAARFAMPAPRDVEFRSRDPRVPDLALRAWWIPGPRADGPAVVLVHGWRSCRRDANVLMAAGMLHQAGFGVLLMDQRDHGDSDDEDLRFAGGTEEYADVLGAWDWLVAQGIPEQRIGIFGVSFGAASSLIAGGEEERVRAVWEDSSFGSVRAGMQDFLVKRQLPEFLIVLAPGAELMARLLAGDDLAATDPLREMPSYAGRPLAIVHGAADDFLPRRHAEDLKTAADAAGVDVREFWIVPGVRHARADVVAWDEYEPRLVRFFTETLGAP